MTQLHALKPRVMTESVSISANELCFVLDKMGIAYGRNATQVMSSPRTTMGSIELPQTIPGHGRKYASHFDISGSMCRDLLLVVSKFRQKLSSIPNYTLSDNTTTDGISTSIFESPTAIEYKKYLVYTLPTQPVVDQQKKTSDEQESKTNSNINRQNSVKQLLFDSNANIENIDDIDGYGSTTVHRNQPDFLPVVKENSDCAQTSRLYLFETEQLSGLSWIINAARAALSYVYSVKADNADQNTSFQNYYLAWKELVDLRYSLKEREKLITEAFADSKRLYEYVKLSRLYDSEIDLLVEKAMVRQISNGTNALRGDFVETTGDRLESRKSDNVPTKKDDYFTPLIEQCWAEQLELELSGDHGKSNMKTALECASTEQNSLPSLSNPLKILMRSVFPVDDLRPAMLDTGGIEIERRQSENRRSSDLTQ